jgi:hypothetical protein
MTHMKRLAFVAAVMAVAACSGQEQKAADSAAAPPAMAPAPAADTGMKMDSAKMKMDSTAKKADSTAKKG